MIIAAFVLFKSLIDLFKDTGFGDVARIFVFLMILSISILAINILNNNYPDIPVQGKQKRTFNWLFLLNFLFLAFLFGFITSEYKSVKQIAAIFNEGIFEMSFEWFITLIAYILVLIFQLIILYGLYVLRRKLYDNFMKQGFEFEN
jgi:hypothetical protein